MISSNSDIKKNIYKVPDTSTSLDHSGQDKIPTKYLSKDLDQISCLNIYQSKARSIMNIELKIQVR